MKKHNEYWKSHLWLVAFCSLLHCSIASAAEVGTMIKADDMKAEPFRDTKTVKALAAGEQLNIVGKDGGWLNVKSGKVSGWVKMLSVRQGDAKKSASNASGLLALSSGRAGTGKIVATTGVRGLNEEELKAARFDAQELQLAESNAVSRSEAQQFATQGKLVARSFDYLPDAK